MCDLFVVRQLLYKPLIYTEPEPQLFRGMLKELGKFEM
jgi:hypothetical protein